MSTKYDEVGVDAQKKGIEVFKSTIDNLFPKAFCTISQDPEEEGQGIVLHTDSAGSKPVQNYLHWRESDELSWFESIGQDVLAMNLDDIMCVGARPISFVDYIAINREALPKEGVLNSLNAGFDKCFRNMEKEGIKTSFLGGETADLPDQMKTLDVAGTISGRVEIKKAITGERIEPGDKIVGLRSGGQTRYEKQRNSGIMCNGITLARHCLMKKKYEKTYPEISGAKKGYYGKFSYNDYHEELGMTVGEAILSPTRLFAPVIHEILEKEGNHVKGIVHNTGGGQTKCLGIGKNIHYVKDKIIDPDPIFRLIKEESGESWRAMFIDYNMGTGFEIILDKDHDQDILDIAEKYELGAKVIGECKKGKGKNKVTIKSRFGNFVYT